MLRLLCLAIAAAATPAFAQQSSVIVDGQKRSVPWTEMLDRPVAAEGLAWGAIQKGLGQYLLLPETNVRVYVRGMDFLKADVNGRLLAVEGVLRKGRMPRAPHGAQGYSRDIEYYYIDVSSWRAIERLANPQVLPRAAR